MSYTPDRLSYKKLELPEEDSEEYKKQREGIMEGEKLELYFALPRERETLGYQSRYGAVLHLTTKELLSHAYFAKAVKQEAIKDGTVSEEENAVPAVHIVKSGDTLYKIARKYSTTVETLISHNDIANANNIKIDDEINLPADATIPEGTKTASSEKAKAAEQQIFYERIDSSTLGSEVHLVVETANLHGKTVEVEVFDKENLLAEDDKTPIKLFQGDTEVTKLKKIKIDDTGKAIVKVKLRPKSDDEYKKLKDKFKDDKEAKLFLKVTCQGDDKKHEKVFLDGGEFEVGKAKCYCNRDLTEEEVKDFVDKPKLFTDPKCPLPESVKTYAEFTKQLNATLKKYNINTCLKIAHFIAQIEAESDHFKTTVEYADGSGYEGRSDLGNTQTGDGKKFKGRGLIQLTGRTNYTKYFNHIDKENLISKPNIIAENIKYTFDSAGWYWVNGSAWGDVNPKADEDDLIAVSIAINGGLNGYPHRKKNLKSILNKMMIEENCINLTKNDIGIYKYDTSRIKESRYGKKTKNKAAIKKFDDQ